MTTLMIEYEPVPTKTRERLENVPAEMNENRINHSIKEINA